MMRLVLVTSKVEATIRGKFNTVNVTTITNAKYVALISLACLLFDDPEIEKKNIFFSNLLFSGYHRDSLVPK